MSYHGKVVLGESVDKLLLQSQIDSTDQIVRANWEEHTVFFKGLEERLQNTINEWSSKFFEEWEIVNVTWPIEIEEDNEGKWFLSASECHANFFEFRFVSYETNIGFVLKFKDLSLEHGLEAFANLEFEQLIFEIRVAYIEDEVSFDQETHKAKLSEYIEFLKKNFEYFKGLLQDTARASEQKAMSYNREAEAILEKHIATVQALKMLEKKELIQEFFSACEDWVKFEEPQNRRLSMKSTVIARALKVSKVHSNRKFVDVEVDELKISSKMTFEKTMYERVFIKTLFGFDLTSSETLKLIGNDL